jgi:hypothetical protein
MRCRAGIRDRRGKRYVRIQELDGGRPKLAVTLHRMWIESTEFRWSSKRQLIGLHEG